MTHTEKYDQLDYKQRFSVGCGACTEATMDLENEVTAYLYEMDHMAAHFAHVYDKEKQRMTSGCLWKLTFRSGNNPVDVADIWHKW